MADFLFSAEGDPKGFRIANLIYAMDGTPIGQIFAERAYRLDGTFVGTLHKNMVVEKPGEAEVDRPPILRPSAFPAPPKCGFRSKAMGMTYPDVFDRLLVSPERRPDGRPSNVRRLWEEEDFFGVSPGAHGAAR